MPRLTLYMRDHCPLCDQALDLLAQVRAPDFDSVWIDDDPALELRFGTRVPVLRNEDDGRELDWPFTIEALRGFLA